MRKLVVFSVLMLAFSFTALAQKADVFGGYQYTNIDAGGLDRYNFNGWNAALTGYFNKSFGITADFSGAYGSPFSESTKLHSYMFGPTLRLPTPKVSPYVHALFGGAHLSASGVSDSAFAYAIGGGVDVGWHGPIAFRLGQFDYLGTRFNGGGIGNDNQSNFRYSTGIVFKF